MLEPLYIYLFVVAVALLWDSLVPDIPLLWSQIPHPVVVLGGIITVLEKAFYRPKKFAGVLFGLCVISIWGGIGVFVEYVIFAYTAYGVVVSVFIVSITLASNAMTTAVKRVMIAIDRDNMASARVYTGRMCSRDTSGMSASDCGRTAMESMAENLSDGVLAPAFYYAMFGLGGLFVYKAINTLDSMVGYKSDRYIKFGWASARLDDVVNWLPARLSAVCILIATITYGKTRTQSALVCIRTYAHTHPSPNAGYPEAAFAGGLHIAFGGRRYYPHVGEVTHWIGDNKRDITPSIMMAGIGLFNRSIYVAVAIIGVVLTYTLPTI